MNDEPQENQAWPPPPTTPLIPQTSAKSRWFVWHYIGGLILSICAGLYASAALAAANGYCRMVDKSPGVEVVILGALLWSAADIVRGALAKKPLRVAFGIVGICIGLYTTEKVFENLTCLN